MKKVTLLAIFGLVLGGTLQAQHTKQAANAMQLSDPTYVNTQSQTFHIINSTTQTVSGYITEGFESTTFPPSNWGVQNIAGPTYTWARSTAQAHSGVASAFMRYDATSGGGEDWLVCPRYQVTATTDSVVFWMRLAYSGYQPDSLCIKVSTTDSLTTSFTTTLLKLREGTNYPTNNTTWYRYAVSLSAYNGQTIYVAFKHYDVDGDGLYVDDVAMGTRPAAEVASTAITSPVDAGAGSQIPAANFINNGSATQTFNVTMEINPGGYTSTSTITALSPSGTTSATFATWTPTPGTYTAKVYTQLSGDANHMNDTILKTVTIYPEFQNYGWSNHTALPAGRWATGPVFAKPCVSATDTGYVYLISGSDASFVNSSLNTRYNLSTGAYTNMAPIPQSRLQISPVRVGTKIYVMGGYASGFSPVTTNSIYDITTDTWSTGAPLPVATGDYAIGVYKDSLIYVVGGYSGTADINTVQIYDTYLNTWTAGTPRTGNAVGGSRMGIVGNQIVVVGGYSQTLATELADATLGVINPSSPATIVWSPLPNFPGGTTGRHGGGVAYESTGLVYFAGGDPNGQGTSTINAVFAYNTTLSRWEHGPNMLNGVSNITNLAGIVQNDSLYLVTMGGYNGVNVTTNNAWLSLGHVAPLPVGPADVAICSGAAATLTAMNGLTYTWTPPTNLSSTNTATTVATPLTTTTYTVTMTKAYGCPIVDPVVVTVNPLPTVVANSTASTVCAGSPVTLTGSGATTYTWTGGVNDGVAFNPTSTNTYTVTGTDANGCSNTANTTVTVNPLPTVVANSTAAAVCAGTSVTLTGSGATSYTWDNSVTDGVAFTPTATTTYMVTGTDANGCSNTDMTTVTVNPLPTVVANATSNAVCMGTSVTLTGSGATTYTWDNSVTDGVAFAPTATTTYMVTGTDANGCSNTDMTTVTVNPLPTVVANATSTSVCMGSSVTLTGSGATTYTWDNSVTDGVAFNPASTMDYIVTGTDANGCSNNDTINVAVNPVPVVDLNNVTQCGGTVTLDAGNPGATFLWNTTATTQAITASTSGTYYVDVTNSFGCVGSDTAVVVINTPPTVTGTATTTTACLSDANIVLTGSPATGTWTGPGVTGSSFSPSSAGVGAQTAVYSYTDANGCSGTASVTITVSACVGVVEMTLENGVNVYPNPNNGTFTIAANANVGDMVIEITDMQGRVVYSSVENGVQAGFAKQISLDNASAGLYIMHITANGQQRTDKISVQK